MTENLNFILKNKEKYRENTEFRFKRTKSNNIDVVRFLLPTQKRQYTQTIDFEKHYFEITIEEFNKLLEII